MATTYKSAIRGTEKQQQNPGKRKRTNSGADETSNEPRAKRVKATTPRPTPKRSSATAKIQKAKKKAVRRSAVINLALSSNLETPTASDPKPDPVEKHLPKFPGCELYAGIPHLYQGYLKAVWAIEAVQADSSTFSRSDLLNEARSIQAEAEAEDHQSLRQQLRRKGAQWASACLLAAAEKEPHTSISGFIEPMKRHALNELEEVYARIMDEYYKYCTQVDMLYFQDDITRKKKKRMMGKKVPLEVQETYLDIIAGLEGISPLLSET